MTCLVLLTHLQLYTKILSLQRALILVGLLNLLSLYQETKVPIAAVYVKVEIPVLV